MAHVEHAYKAFVPNISETDTDILVTKATLIISLRELEEQTQDPDVHYISSVLLGRYQDVTRSVLIEITGLFLFKGYVYIVKLIDELYSIIDKFFLQVFCDSLIVMNEDVSHLIYTFFYLFDSNVSPFYFTKNHYINPETRRNIALFYSLWIRNRQ